MTSLVLLIPAYRPQPNLPDLVRAMLEASPDLVRAVVVDDGSGPAHAQIFDRLRALPNVTVVPHAINLGKGAALKTGFNVILASDPAVTGIVTADADGQHRPADVARVAAAHADHPGALILGVRAFRGAVPARSRIGNDVTRFIFRLVAGFPMKDTQTGLRVWPRAQCLEALRLRFSGYEFEFEALMQAPRASIRELSIETVYEPGNPTSHFNPIRDSLRIYFVFVRYSASAIVAAVIDSTVFTLVLSRTANIARAQVAGRIVAIVAAFFLLRGPVFRSTGRLWPLMARYLALVVVSGIVSFGLIRVLMNAGLNPLASKLLAEGTLFGANFAVQRTMIFRRD